MTHDLAVVNGRVVMPSRVVNALNIGVRDGRIVTLTTDSIDAEKTIDATGLTVFPGVIDEHFHVFEGYGWETYEGATRAAAKGGVTTVVDMPIEKPPTTSAELVREKRERIAGTCYVDYALFGGYPAGRPEDVAEMVEAGVVAFKLFTGELSPPGMYPGVTDAQMLDAMRRAHAAGAIVVVHSENESIVHFETQRLKEEGHTDSAIWDEVRPWFAEVDAIQRVGLLSEVTGCRAVIAHTTGPRGVLAVTDARGRGADTWVETTPHNLCITKEDMARNPELKWNPPSRSRADVDALWDLLLDDQVHTVGSDHAPLPKTPGADIWDQPPGAGNSVETMFPVVATEGLDNRGLTLQRLAEVFSTTPAKVFGLFPRKGAISLGADADFLIADLAGRRTLDARDLEYLEGQTRWSPFDGQELTGYSAYTIVRGEIVFAEGEVTGSPAFGQLVQSGAAHGMTSEAKEAAK